MADITKLIVFYLIASILISAHNKRVFSSLNKAISIAILALLIASSGSLIWGASNNGPLSGDGSMWYFVALESLRPFDQIYYYRYICNLLQWPVMVLTNIFSLPASFIVGGLSFSLTIHPIISLAACYAILRKYSALSFFVFPVLSFAICTLPMMPNPTLVVAETLSVFWPLFLLLLFRNGKNGELAAILFLNIIMAFAYEAALTLVAINVVAILSRTYLRKMRLSKTDIFLIGVQLLSFTFYFYRLIGPDAGPTAPFFKAMFEFAFDLNRLMPWFFLTVLLISGATVLIFPALAIIVLVEVFMISGFFSYLYVLHILTPERVSSLFYSIWCQRVFIIPFGFVLASMTIFAFWNQRRWQSCIPIFTTVAVISLSCSLTNNIVLNRLWAEAYTKLIGLQKFDGCNIISQFDHQRIFQDRLGLGATFFPYLSIVLHKSWNPDSMIMVEKEPTGKSCLPVDQNFIFEQGTFVINTATAKRFDYSKILGGPIRILEWDDNLLAFKESKIIARQ